MDIVEKLASIELANEADFQNIKLTAIDHIIQLRAALSAIPASEPIGYVNPADLKDDGSGFFLLEVWRNSDADENNTAPIYTTPPSADVLVEALRKLEKYPSTRNDEMSAMTMRKIANEALNAYQAKLLPKEE